MYIAAFNHLTPFPGTPLYRRLESEGRLRFERWWLDPAYRYGMVPFTPARLSPEAVQEACVRSRASFYSVPCILRRSLDFRVNSSNFFMWTQFFVINAMMRNEVSQRDGYPLGDENESLDLLPVALPV